MIKHFPTVFISLFLMALHSSCRNAPNNNGLEVEEVVPVSVIPLVQENREMVIHATGLFSTDDETFLSFKNGGIIEKVYGKEGDFVKKGQLLALLNRTEINARASQVRSALEKAERDYQRATQLYKDSIATLEQKENAGTALDVAKQDWNAIQFNLQYSEIRAPFDGYILLKLANEGQIVGPGTPVLQINGAGKGNWLVKVGVSDRQWAEIQEGDSATISGDAFQSIVSGRVIRKSEGMNPGSGTFTVYVQPHSLSKVRIASGMFAKVLIFGKSFQSWLIPYESLLDGDTGKGYVFVTDDGQTAKKVEVTTGTILKDKVSVLTGLNGHQSLIVSGSPYLKDGSKIKIIEK